MERNSFIFYRSFYEAISDLPDEQQLEIYKAIASYSFDFKEPELSGVSKSFWKLIRPNLEANNKRFENGKKPKKKQNRSKTEAKQKQNRSKAEANKDVDKDKEEDVNVEGDVYTQKKIEKNDKQEKIPEKKEFMAYGKEILKDKYNDYEFALEAKFDSWVASGWKDGNGSKIKSWRNKLRNVIPFLKPFNNQQTNNFGLKSEIRNGI
jgi:hypothetical protein